MEEEREGLSERIERKIVEERWKKTMNFLLGKKFLFVLLGLVVLLILAWHTRTVNVPNLKDITTNEYTLGPDLDPYLFLRYAKYIVKNGELMALDKMRYVPLGYPTASGKGMIVLPYIIAYFHKIVNLFGERSIEYSAVMFPAFMFLLTVLAFFLFIRKVFEKHECRDIIALIASAFLIVSPSLLARTVAGIPEKESVGFFFMFLAFYFFLSAWKSQKSKISDNLGNKISDDYRELEDSRSYQNSDGILKSKTLKKSLILASLAGLSTVLMGLIWGGWIYVFVIIALFAFIEFLFGKVNSRKLFVYGTWIILSIILSCLFPSGNTLKGMIASTSSGLAFAIFSIILIDFFIFKTKIKNLNFIQNLRKRVPDKFISLSFFIILGIIFSSLIFSISFIPDFIGHVSSILIQPSQTRLDFTVAENKQPYFNEWADSFGPVIRGVPLLFWLFFLGSIFLFYGCIKRMGKKGRIILTFSYVIFLFALIFSRYSSSSSLNGTNSISKMVYLGGVFVIIVGSGIIGLKRYGNKARSWYYSLLVLSILSILLISLTNNIFIMIFGGLINLGFGVLSLIIISGNEEFKKINSSYLFLLAFFFVSLIGARGAIRLIMVLSAPTAGIVGYFFISVITKAKKHKEETLKLIFITAAIIVVVASLYGFYFNYKVTVAQARAMVPSMYTQQWQKAMKWVRESTPENAVFSHWWDYGYWIQSIGNRATILDGGNSVSYWNYLLGRHVLTGQSEKEALEFLYAHNATHLLIDSTEIGKYTAYSSIGSDENYDRYSQISTFIEDEKSVQEMKNETFHIYTGSMFLDEDYLLQEGDKQEFLPAYRTGIGGIILRTDENNKVKQPQAVFIYQGKQFNVLMRYIYFQGKLYDFGEGYGGCLYMIPRLVSSGVGGSVKDTGQGLFLTEKTMRALWVKLYLFDDGENFELAHKEENFIIGQLKNQGFIVEDFIMYSGVQGPIKIWKINYPEDIEFKEEYLSTEYPDSVRMAKPSFY